MSLQSPCILGRVVGGGWVEGGKLRNERRNTLVVTATKTGQDTPARSLKVWRPYRSTPLSVLNAHFVACPLIMPDGVKWNLSTIGRPGEI